MAYYGVHIPRKTNAEECDETTVFTCKSEALKLLKDHKDARLKVFKNHEEALKFAQLGFELCPIKANSLKSPSSASNPEKLDKPFPTPTKQELACFRKRIEQDNYEDVKQTIYENPAYLVHINTPTNLKEGPRYNALHVCAIHNRARIAELILKTISEWYFVSRLREIKDQKLCEEISEILVDYYLNMPEKGRNETPLHLAVKYGSLEVVEVLTTYPRCEMKPNSDNLYPKDIVCSRMNNPSQEIKDKILILLNEKYYVPVIRSIDNSLPPTIGEPYPQTDPPKLNTDPLSPERKIEAVAGPMNKEQAENFRKRWKTPPRIPSSPTSSNSPYSPFSPLNSIHSTPNKYLNNNNSTTPIIHWSKSSSIPGKLHLEDKQNGNVVDIKATENNNDLNQSLYPFSISTPMRTNPKRKELLLAYRDKNQCTELDDSDFCKSPVVDTPDKSIFHSSFKERHLKLSDTEKGLEMIGRELAKEQRVDWKEYWDFLDSFVDISSSKGLDQLENYLKEEQIKNEKSNKSEIQTVQNNLKNESMNDLCNALKMFMIQNDTTKKFNTERNNIFNHAKTIENYENTNDIKATSITPYSCIEKSLQVYAKRLTKTISHNVESKGIVSIIDSFNSELTRLKSLVCSFKNDTRFSDVEFSLVHSRFANLIVWFLRNSNDISENIIRKVKVCVEEIMPSKSEKTEPMYCVTNFILEYFNFNGDLILPENLKTEAICEATWRNEKHCNCRWNVDRRRQTMSKRNKRMELSQVTRKLFDWADDQEEHKIENEPKSDISTSSNESKKSEEDEEDNFCDVEEDEPELFWSDVGSDDGEEKFYTPPESPSILELDVSDDAFENYKTYLLGSEPTKRDLDVINALFNVEINRIKYPNIHRWRAAVLRHSNEERDNFPSPCVVKCRLPLMKLQSPLVKRSLLRQTRLPLSKSGDEFNHLNNCSSVTENNSILISPIANKSSLGSPITNNLSYMNVSSEVE